MGPRKSSTAPSMLLTTSKTKKFGKIEPQWKLQSSAGLLISHLPLFSYQNFFLFRNSLCSIGFFSFTCFSERDFLSTQSRFLEEINLSTTLTLWTLIYLSKLHLIEYNDHDSYSRPSFLRASMLTLIKGRWIHWVEYFQSNEIIFQKHTQSKF